MNRIIYNVKPAVYGELTKMCHQMVMNCEEYARTRQYVRFVAVKTMLMHYDYAYQLAQLSELADIVKSYRRQIKVIERRYCIESEVN